MANPDMFNAETYYTACDHKFTVGPIHYSGNWFICYPELIQCIARNPLASKNHYKVQISKRAYVPPLKDHMITDKVYIIAEVPEEDITAAKTGIINTVWIDGRKERYVDGLLHGEDDDTPAVVWPNGSGEAYYQHGLLHRLQDKPALIRNDKSNGHRLYRYRHGYLHSDDNDTPAVEEPHLIQYCKHGRLHRTGGKYALQRSTGMCSWYVNGVLQKEAYVRGASW